MSDFNITLDTTPMAHSVDTVNSHVKGVTTAVVAMEAAVVASEVAASKKICRNVDNGFYMLMSSQLSQKMAACRSTIDSKTLIMDKFRGDVEQVRRTMGKDYARLERQYTKIFTTLNRELETRVHELDRRAYDLAKIMSQALSPNKDDDASVMLCGEETECLVDKSGSAKVKQKAAQTITMLKENVSNELEYNKKVRHILSDRELKEDHEEYVPVMVTESESMINRDNTLSGIYMPGGVQSSKSSIENSVNNADCGWQEVGESEMEKIKFAFNQCCASSDMDERVAKEVARLFSESHWKTATAQKSDGGEQ